MRSMRGFFLAFLVFLGVGLVMNLALVIPADAQVSTSTGSIGGTVTDASGAVITNAKITITGPTGQTIHTTTGESGSYSSGAVIPGVYAVRIEATGFKTEKLSLNVLVDNVANGSVKLEIGSESTVIEVEGSAVQVNTVQATVQGVLSTTQIENLPVNGRNFLDLAQLEPGVQIQDGTNFDPTKVGYSSISFGSRFGRTARINVDGVDVSDETVGTTTEDIPASSIQEFSLAQSSLDLSNDLTSSGAVNVVTKAGTDVYHGEAFGFFRDSSIGAAALPTPPGLSSPYQRNQEGGNLGGPLIKDKLYFFADGERTLQHLAAPVLEADPLSSYSGTFPAPFKEGMLTSRLDYALTKTTRLFYRYNYFQNSVYATFFPSSFQVYNNKNYTRNHVVGLDSTTGSFTHSFRFSYLKFQNQIVDATRGSSLPFANFPVSINIGSFTVGPNLLAPQSTPQSDHQFKYDGSKMIGKHIIRFGAGWNHIQGGGFASFFKIDPQVYGTGGDYCQPGVGGYTATTCPAGPDGTPASNPLDYFVVESIVGNGQGFSTKAPALGFPAGGLGPDNRLGLYIGDTWKTLKNLTVTAGLRWDRDTGRTDSDLPAPGCTGVPAPCVALNTAFPGYGNPVHQPNLNFAPQLGIAWDVTGNGKTSVRAGIGLFYENVIFNNVLFDRPLREPTGAFLQYPAACYVGSALPVAVPTTPANPSGTISVGTDPTTGANYCTETIGQAGAGLAAFESQYQADTPFSLTAANPSYIGTALAEGLNEGAAMFAPNYVSPRSVQMNFGVQHEIRPGLVFSADYLRNVTTHSLLGIDINQTGAARHFNLQAAQYAINQTIAACQATSLAAAIAPSGCPGLHPASGTSPAGSATISDFVTYGLGSPGDVGSSCMDAANANPYGCAFGGINPQYGSMIMLEPISRSVFNALQMKLAQNVKNPIPGVKTSNFQISYQLAQFINPLAAQGDYPPSNPVSSNDQDFVLQAADNDHPLRYMGPSLLDRRHQISFGGTFEVPYGFRLGIMAHFYSPLSSPAIVGDTGTGGQIFQTDFTGSGVWSDPLPGTKNGAFMRQFGVSGLNAAINNYNQTVANQATPAGQVLINAGLFTLAQLQTIGAVAPALLPAPANQMVFPWLRACDLKLSWRYRIRERVTLEPGVGFYNVFNFANFNLPPGTMTGWLNEGGSSINSTVAGSASAQTFRVGVGTGVFALGSPRTTEFGLRLTF